MKNKENTDALKKFLLDIDALDSIEQRVNKFNLFDVLGVVRAELRHSSMLAWLISPDENHGLGSRFLQEIINFYVGKCQPDNSLKILNADLSDVIVAREWKNIDILAVSEGEKIVIAIENKVDTGEHSNQLERYRKIVEDRYGKEYIKIYIFLTKMGSESSDPLRWKSLSYVRISKILKGQLGKINLPDGPRFLIENYIDVIERFIVDDQELRNECIKIYLNHRKAIDLIIENIPNPIDDARSVIEKWINQKNSNGELFYYSQNTNKTYHRFETFPLKGFLPGESTGEYSQKEWRDHFFFCEVVNNGEGIFMQISLLFKNAPDEMYQKILHLSDGVISKRGWVVCFKSSEILDNSKMGNFFDANELERGLDRQFDELIEFEKSIIESYKSAEDNSFTL